MRKIRGKKSSQKGNLGTSLVPGKKNMDFARKWTSQLQFQTNPRKFSFIPNFEECKFNLSNMWRARKDRSKIVATWDDLTAVALELMDNRMVEDTK